MVLVSDLAYKGACVSGSYDTLEVICLSFVAANTLCHCSITLCILSVLSGIKKERLDFMQY